MPLKLKSIITTGSKTRIGSQDSSEKQITFQDSNEVSMKKKVKFAKDTVFEQAKVKRGIDLLCFKLKDFQMIKIKRIKELVRYFYNYVRIKITFSYNKLVY